MEKYELMVILKPLLPEDVKNGVEKRLLSLIKKYKGKVLETDVWGKRHLAYPIKKHDEGYYIVYKLELEPSTIPEMEKEMRLINDLLRFLLVKEDNQ